MTKTSKFLTILVTFFSILYMGTAFMMWAVQVNWKEKANVEFPKKTIDDQKVRIQELDQLIAATDKQHEEAKKGIAADILAISAPEIGRAALLEKEWAQLNVEVSNVAGQIEAEAKKVQAKQDEDKKLREDVQRLQSQYQDLVEQRTDAEANVKRLRDLLVQSEGVLARLRARSRLLDIDEGKKPYSEDETSNPAASRPAKTLK